MHLMFVVSGLLSDDGLSFSNVTGLRLYLGDMSRYSEVNAEYLKRFTVNPPARLCVEVAAEPSQLMLDIAAWKPEESKVSQPEQVIYFYDVTYLCVRL